MNNKIKPDIIATVFFYKTEDGGRQSPTPSNFFNCPLLINNNYYDCRLLLTNIGKIFPGDTVRVPIKFVLPKVIRELRIGDTFYIWELGIKGEGKVEEICK